MEVITNKARKNNLISLDKYYPVNDIAVFDIETTGFTANNTVLYLIGCAYYKDNEWYITQWFNDDGESEGQIIHAFFDFIKDYRLLMHYNGDGFDIPYLKKKIELGEYDYSFDKIESVDLYKLIKQFKNILHLDNLKQKSLEKFIGINRLDKYSGGDLIKVYNDYIKKSSLQNKQLLLQHNYEDLEGFLYCTSLLSLNRFKAGCFSVKNMTVRSNKLLFILSLDYPIPKRITVTVGDILISGYKEEASVTVPIYSGDIKFFFDNYKEYYYLPAEDMAVHKSVSSYVDKNYRIQAKRDNCYVRHQGHFITQLDANIVSGYKFRYSDKESYIELSDSFLQNMDLLNAYARNIIGRIN